MFQSFKKKIIYTLTNKYLLSFCVFVVWICFLDANSLIHQRKLDAEIENLTENRNYYRDKLEEIKTNENTIMTDMARLEKFARENYLMKKADEDLFLIKNTSSKVQ